VILSMTAIEGGYRVELDAAALATAGSIQDEIVIAERARRGLVFYKGRLVRPPRARRIFVDVLEDSVVPIAGATPPIPIIKALMRLAVGTFALLSSDLGEIVDTFVPPLPEPPIELTVLQDGAGRRALLIPHLGTTHRPLDAGTYELRFAIDRQRWPTQAPDTASRYQSAATVTVKV
jgi:hypothetical protein